MAVSFQCMTKFTTNKKKIEQQQQKDKKNESHVCFLVTCSFPDFTVSSFQLRIVCQRAPRWVFPAIRHFSKKPW